MHVVPITPASKGSHTPAHRLVLTDGLNELNVIQRFFRPHRCVSAQGTHLDGH